MEAKAGSCCGLFTLFPGSIRRTKSFKAGIDVNMIPLQQPEFYLANVANKFDTKGKLNDEETKQKIGEVWKALIELIRNNKK